ncbi:MAG TPA: FMN-binding protein [Chloroflexota bacterium]|nr:FMN-binding protein [Chloroflexota bacterium]
MKYLRRTAYAVLMSGAVLPVGAAWATPGYAAPPHVHAKAKAYKGPVVNMQWGPVQVTVYISGKRITNVKATAPMERPQSNQINSIALPALRSEVLKAQSGKIHVLSGATMTSKAYIKSLHGALKKAHHA